MFFYVQINVFNIYGFHNVQLQSSVVKQTTLCHLIAV